MTQPAPDESPGSELGPAGEENTGGPRWRNTHSSGPSGLSTATPPHAPPPLLADDHASHTAASLPRTLADREASAGFGTLLEPVIHHATGDRLSDIHWFRCDWQRGGAMTGYATFRDDRGTRRPVVVKLPVPPCERHWLVRLQDADHVVPRVYAHGEALNGYDLAWVVMERLPHGPLGPHWDGREFDLLVEAVGRFYHAARGVPRVGEPVRQDWEHLLNTAREHVAQNAVPEPQRWKTALKKARRQVREWARRWEGRPCDDWCHGDLHLANAMTRAEPPGGPAVLFDFARTRVGHWLQDAVYLEHLFWARPERLGGRRLCSQIAHERKRHGLPVDPDWPRLAEAKRTLLALSTPATLTHDGDPHHVHAALQVLERAV